MAWTSTAPRFCRRRFTLQHTLTLKLNSELFFRNEFCRRFHLIWAPLFNIEEKPALHQRNAPRFTTFVSSSKSFATIRHSLLLPTSSSSAICSASVFNSTASLIFFQQRRMFRASASNEKLGFFRRLFGKNENVEHSIPLKTMLDDSKLSKEEQQRIRMAFAEGYLQSFGAPKSRGMRFFSVVRDVLGTAVIVAVFLMLLSLIFRRNLSTSGEVVPEDVRVTFADVLGVDEAKVELQDIVAFLKNPERFSSLGGKLPKGVLLVGPPGTGKTLLARAVAGEANVPFFHASGSEFDEVLVGQGARRMRDLFALAKLRAPCVIFIDEIDSVGSKRTNSPLHPYANQTLNQLLTEMDGFRKNDGVIVLGATNRRDDLDPALLRPGRFDVEVQVSIPDLAGRIDILNYYLNKVKAASDVSVDVLARGTTGFTGADLENMVNQAALRATIVNAPAVSHRHLEEARDKILMGPERRSRIPDDEANRITAYHEGGHALVALYSKDAHPLHKVTIVPRGPSLGHTAYIPAKESYHVTKAQMLATLDTLMGGRAAEELIFGSDKITSGASSDFKQATELARQMVKDWGMSDKVGVRKFEDNSRSLVVVNELSPSTTEVIDQEIRRLLNESLERAKSILKKHQREHEILAEALLKYETLDAEEVKQLLKDGLLKK